MEMVWLTALGVGGATVIGALIGFLFKKPSHRLHDVILSFAAGVMLAAAVIGLILPSLEHLPRIHDNLDRLRRSYTNECIFVCIGNGIP